MMGFEISQTEQFSLTGARSVGGLRTGRAWLTPVLGACLVALPLLASAETKSFALTGFDGVSVSEGIHVVVDAGESFAITAESDDPRQLERLELDVRRNTLRAEMDSKLFSLVRTKGWKVTVRVSMPELVQAVTSSGATLTADEMSGAALELNASSGSSMEIGSVKGESISVTAASGARIAASEGDCLHLKAELSSGSELRFSAVECDVAEVSASSGSTAGVFADKSIDASASSGSTVQVFGEHEKIEIDSSSGGSIVFP